MSATFTIRHSAALISAIELLISTKTIKPGIGKTLQAIAAFWNPNGNIYPSQSTLAAMTGNHRRTIVSHVSTLAKLGVIQTRTQPGRFVNGVMTASTLCYSFNSPRIGQLFNIARSTLKQAAIKAAKLAKNDHSAPSENDHTIKAKAQVEKITVSASLADWFKSICKKAFQHEADHTAGLAKKQAYKAAVHRNRVARGQEFSRAEQKRRAEAAKRIQPIRQQAASKNQRIDELARRLRESRFMPDRFTPDMRTELLQLTGGGTSLDLPSRIALGL